MSVLQNFEDFLVKTFIQIHSIDDARKTSNKSSKRLGEQNLALGRRSKDNFLKFFKATGLLRTCKVEFLDSLANCLFF